MIRLTRPSILCITFLLSTASTVAFTTSCAQPLPNCGSSHGDYAAEYTLTSGDANSVCGQLIGDVLGMSPYFESGGLNNTPNYEKASVAIRAAAAGALIDYAEERGAIVGDEVYYDANAIAPFTAGFPDDDEFCMTGDFNDASVSLPAIDEVLDDPATPDDDESLPAQAAIDFSYKWSNARFLVSANAPGTQFEADLEYTQDGCTATYHVKALYPAIPCETTEDCTADDSGLNPDFAVRCNTDLGMCVLDGDLPAYE